MERCNCARLATSRSGPRTACENKSRASLNWRAWNSFIAASKLVNWLGAPAAGTAAAPVERALDAELAGSLRLVALGACGLLIRRSGIFGSELFSSGIPACPLRAHKGTSSVYTRPDLTRATSRSTEGCVHVSGYGQNPLRERNGFAVVRLRVAILLGVLGSFGVRLRRRHYRKEGSSVLNPGRVRAFEIGRASCRERV